jgi:hypothetical protein
MVFQFSSWFLIIFLLSVNALAVSSDDFFEIRVLDADTGRGVPLAELETVNHVRYVTDNSGRIAFLEPGLWNKTLFFHVKSHGYEFPKDGFGITGTRLKPKPGARTEIKLKRLNIAERLYRITGEGLYRDSVLLGEKPPIEQPLLNAEVYGQDSVQPVLFQGKIFWFWGDTQRASYPLGNFRMSGAYSELPAKGGLNPAVGMNLHYFTNSDGFAKGMFPFEPKDGLVWADGFLTLTNQSGKETMMAHFERLKGLGKSLEHGLSTYNERKEEFERTATFDLNERWRAPHGHPVFYRTKGQAYYYFGAAFRNVRVRAEMKALLDPLAYESWTCLAEGARDLKNANVTRDSAGRLLFRWTTNAIPTGPNEEKELIAAGIIKQEEAFFQPMDLESKKVVQMHAGSVYWNDYRKRWILIAVEHFGSSFLGEVWYSEAEQLTGPWKKARKIISHDNYSFYNPVQQPFFDQEGGRLIYLQGTYTMDFSGNKIPTPRYDYNQVMYRLDLDDARLRPLRD